VIIACNVRLYNVVSEHMPYSQGLHWHTLWLCPVTFGSPVILNFLGTNFVLPFALLAFILVQLMFPLIFFGNIDDACLLLRKKKAHAPFSNQCCSCTNNCNVFFRPVGCIFVGYVISSILLPYLPLVCVRLILGAMGTDESHWSPGTIFSFYLHSWHA